VNFRFLHWLASSPLQHCGASMWWLCFIQSLVHWYLTSHSWYLTICHRCDSYLVHCKPPCGESMTWCVCSGQLSLLTPTPRLTADVADWGSGVSANCTAGNYIDSEWLAGEGTWRNMAAFIELCQLWDVLSDVSL